MIHIFVKYVYLFSLTCLLCKCSNALVWDELMESAVRTTGEISDALRPYLVENFPTANVSRQCSRSLLSYAEGIRSFEPWAIKMFDATGKLPSSFLKGTHIDFGSFDECLSLVVSTDDFFRGRFCMLSLRSPLMPLKYKKAENESYTESYGHPPEWAKETTKIMERDYGDEFGLYLGICIPSTCSESDLTNIISAYTKPAELEISLTDCQVNESRKWSTSEKIAIFSMIFLVMMIIIGTVFDFLQRKRNSKSGLCSNAGTKQNILQAFSAISNWEILFPKKVTDNSLNFIHGMKFLTTIWMLFLHTFAYESLWEFRRFKNYSNIRKLRSVLNIMQENCLPNTTYFMFMNGFLSTYSLKNKQSSHKDYKRNNGVLKLILIKYLRIVPSIIFLMSMGFVIPVTLNGPIWNSTWNHVQNRCLKSGWANLLFVGNFVEYGNHCWVHLWVLSALMQFQVICLPLLFMAKRHPKFAIILGSVIAIGCGVRDFIVSYQNEYNFASAYAMGSMQIFTEYAENIYLKPYNYFATYGIGMIFGWINLKNFKLSKLSLTICWILYVPFTLVLYYIVMYRTENLIFVAFHNAFRNWLFSLQIGWVMYTCLNGTAGIIGNIFSWKPLIPLGKILNSLNLYHPVLLVTFEALRRERFYFSVPNFLQHTLALFIYSLLLGAVTFLMVDSPFNRLCDMWEGKNSAPPQETSKTHSENHFTATSPNGLSSQKKEKKT